MFDISSHITKLKDFTAPSMHDGENKIYFLEVEEKLFPKVGDTHRDVDVRNQETMTNAALHRKKGTEPFYVLARKEDGTTFRDKEFHAYLRKAGYVFELNDQGNDSEWVMADPNGAIPTVPQLLLELEKFMSKPVYKAFTARKAQVYLIDALAQSVTDGYEKVNLGACVRAGKTNISLSHAANNNAMPVYIGKNLTSQASAKDDNDTFGLVPEMLTQSLHGIDELDDNNLSKKANKIIEQIEATNVNDRKIIFYVDEVDDASHTKKSRDVLKPVVNHFRDAGMMLQVITMSGTRVYRGLKVLNYLFDGPVEELALEYYEMQILQPEKTVNRNYRHISFYSEDQDGLANISDAMKTSKGRESIATTISKLIGNNDFSPVDTTNFPHWFIKFATVGKSRANQLVSFLNKNYSTVNNTEFLFVNINGDYTCSEDAQDFCKDVIKDNPTKVCVFITQGMATTSFSVAGIGNSAVFSDNLITADDTQALHRSATWTEGKTDCNMFFITTNDSKDLSFDDIFEDETKVAGDRDSKQKIYRELLLNNSMIHYAVNGNRVRPVEITADNVEDMLDEKAKAMTKTASFMQVMLDLDEEIKEEIFATIAGVSSYSERSVSTKGEVFDPFGKNAEKETKKRLVNDAVSLKQQEKIMRGFVESAVLIPALAQEQGVALDEVGFFCTVGLTRDLFFRVYDASPMFKDRIDTIFNLCDNKKYLFENYVDRMAA